MFAGDPASLQRRTALISSTLGIAIPEAGKLVVQNPLIISISDDRRQLAMDTLIAVSGCQQLQHPAPLVSFTDHILTST